MIVRFFFPQPCCWLTNKLAIEPENANSGTELAAELEYLSLSKRGTREEISKTICR